MFLASAVRWFNVYSKLNNSRGVHSHDIFHYYDRHSIGKTHLENYKSFILMIFFAKQSKENKNNRKIKLKFQMSGCCHWLQIHRTQIRNRQTNWWRKFQWISTLLTISPADTNPAIGCEFICIHCAFERSNIALNLNSLRSVTKTNIKQFINCNP